MILRLLIVFILAITLHGCAGRVVTPPMSKGIPLQEMCDRYHVQWQWDGVTQVVLLQYQGNKAKALVGSKTVLVGRDRIELSAPLRRENSIIYVPEDFESKVLAPFGVIGTSFPKADLFTSRIQTIIIDAGHGGKDPGAKGVTGLLEKDVNLDVAKRLRELLDEAGLKVIMTRTTDEFITLPKRTEIATKSDADIFISIHANSNPSKKTKGLEVYYVKTQNKKDLEEEQRDKNERSFINRVSAGGYNKAVSAIVEDMMYQKKVEHSSLLAQKIVRQVSRQVEAENRGARPCRFFVVRNTLIPAVLIELGYLTNREEERRLSSSSYRQKFAEAIAHSILDYAND